MAVLKRLQVEYDELVENAVSTSVGYVKVLHQKIDFNYLHTSLCHRPAIVQHSERIRTKLVSAQQSDFLVGLRISCTSRLVLR
jgi:hypothetical protein